MTCAQGLLRLLWGGAEVGVLRDCKHAMSRVTFGPMQGVNCNKPLGQLLRNCRC